MNKSKWTSLSAFTLILSQFIIYLIITRYVNSYDLGLYALASSIVIIPVSLIEFSFSSSLIHKENPQPKDYRSVLTLNMVTAISATVLCSFIAIIFAYLYENQKIWLFVSCMSPIICLAAFNNVHLAGLKKEMRFEKLSILELVSNTIAFMVTLFAIVMEWGIWSLVILIITKYLTVTIGLISAKLLYCQFKIERDRITLIQHFNFGKYILGEKGLSSILSYLDVFLIGCFLGVSTLGVYDVLKRILLRPVLVLYAAIESVIFPLLSNHKNNILQYRKIYEAFISLSNFLFIPVLLLAYIFSDWLLKVLPQAYHGQADVLQSICFLGVSIVIFNPTDILLYSQGKTRLFFKWLLAYTLPMLVLMLVSVQLGLVFFIYALAFFYIIMHSIAYFVLFKSDLSILFNKYYSPVVLSISIFIGLNLLSLSWDGVQLKVFSFIFTTLVILINFFLSTRSKQITLSQ